MAEDATTAAVRECLIFTRWAIVDLEAASLERVASYLDGLVSHEPLRSGRGWANERMVISCIVTDLRTMVRDAGEPIGAARDLRDAKTKADELDAIRRIELAERDYDHLITEAIGEDHHAREFRPASLTEDPAPAPVTPAADPSDQPVTSWI
jgi:hypothetical protein